MINFVVNSYKSARTGQLIGAWKLEKLSNHQMSKEQKSSKKLLTKDIEHDILICVAVEQKRQNRMVLDK